MYRFKKAICAAGLIAAGGCSGSVPCAAGDAPCLVLAEVQRLSQEYGEEFDSLSVEVGVDSSRVVPGLAYFVADYWPPGTGDIRLTASAAARDGRAELIGTVADWIDVVGEWAPNGGDDVIAACGEIAVLASPSQLYYRPFVYETTMSANDLVQRLVLFDDSTALQILGDPRVEPEDGGWAASLWIIQARRSVRLECRMGIGPDSRLVVSVRSTDETDRVGMSWSP